MPEAPISFKDRVNQALEQLRRSVNPQTPQEIETFNLFKAMVPQLPPPLFVHMEGNVAVEGGQWEEQSPASGLPAPSPGTGDDPLISYDELADCEETAKEASEDFESEFYCEELTPATQLRDGLATTPAQQAYLKAREALGAPWSTMPTPGLPQDPLAEFNRNIRKVFRDLGLNVK